ncbi:hypothetical protein DFH11DRAFT_1541121 [Phellopilus nigrolimitatus]|nr:hypothetical protein DFH11DRAFT_1541121 [Phellopilus nigrolimitatus]
MELLTECGHLPKQAMIDVLSTLDIAIIIKPDYALLDVLLEYFALLTTRLTCVDHPRIWQWPHSVKKSIFGKDCYFGLPTGVERRSVPTLNDPSGVSYAILKPGKVPDVLPVTRFSGLSTGASKIPFKMHLRPSGIALQTNGLKIGDLPPGKSAEKVMGDFLNYLFVETVSYIQSSHADGEDIWNQVKDHAIFVLGHPNGWTGLSQQRYRNSAILGALIPNTDEGRKRVKFVTEGEASALTCLSGGLGPARLEVGARMGADWAINQMSDITKQVGFRFVIADAGGGTLDISSYEVTKSSPVELKQCAPSDCRFAGSVFVDRSGLKLLKSMRTANCLSPGKLRNSCYDYDDVLDGFINDEFEKKTKREFGGDSEYGLLKVGDRGVRDNELGIRNGFLRLDRVELSECFSMSVKEALDSIRSQVTKISRNYETIPVWLVGGFASSPYLLKRLNDSLGPEGVSIQRPDTSLEKVANGAVLHFLDRLVTARVCPASYGITSLVFFNFFLSDHRQHSDLVQHGQDGPWIGPVFDCIVEKGTRIDEAKTFKKAYTKEFFFKSMAERFTAEIFVYDGDLPVPTWFEENKNKFRTLCKMEADLSDVCTEPSPKSSIFDFFFRRTPEAFWKASFEIELKFGTTELEARIKWEANSRSQGKTKYGPVSIVYPE